MKRFGVMHVALAVIVVVVVTVGTPLQSTEPSFRPLDFTPRAVSANGGVVVGYRGGGPPPDAPPLMAVRWTADGGASVLGEGAAAGVSADGSIIVGTQGGEAVRWTRGGGLEVLAPGYASGTTADGSIVLINQWAPRDIASNSVGSSSLWSSQRGPVPFDMMTGYDSNLTQAISADGSVIAGTAWSDDGKGNIVSEAYRWTADGGFVSLFRHAWEHLVTGISADGSVVVGAGFRWTAEEGVVDLRFDASGVSADGSVIVGWRFLAPYDVTEALIWDHVNGTRNLRDVLGASGADVSGWDLRIATAISADGLTIVGTGIDPSGQSVGWIATVPEPTAATLSAGAVLLLYRRGRRQAGTWELRSQHPDGSWRTHHFSVVPEPAVLGLGATAVGALLPRPPRERRGARSDGQPMRPGG